jgi:hypothetical protein
MTKVLEVWSKGYQQPMSLASLDHAGDSPSTRNHQVGSKKDRVKYPCRLCEGNNQTYLYPCMDKDSCLLEDIVVSHKQLANSYHKISIDQPLVDKVVDMIQSSVNPTLSLESEVQVVDPIPPSINPTLPLKSEVNIVQVLLVLTNNSRQGGILLVSTEPPPSIEVVYFDWNRLMTPRLPCYFPFQIIAEVFDINICHFIIDEGASIRILSSNAWKSLGSPQLVPGTQNLMDLKKKSQ